MLIPVERVSEKRKLSYAEKYKLYSESSEDSNVPISHEAMHIKSSYSLLCLFPKTADQRQVFSWTDSPFFWGVFSTALKSRCQLKMHQSLSSFPVFPPLNRAYQRTGNLSPDVKFRIGTSDWGRTGEDKGENALFDFTTPSSPISSPVSLPQAQQCGCHVSANMQSHSGAPSGFHAEAELHSTSRTEWKLAWAVWDLGSVSRMSSFMNNYAPSQSFNEVLRAFFSKKWYNSLADCLW